MQPKTSRAEVIKALTKSQPKSVKELVKATGFSRESVTRTLIILRNEKKTRIAAYRKPAVGALVPLWSLGSGADEQHPGKVPAHLSALNIALSRRYNKLRDRKIRLMRELRETNEAIVQIEKEIEQAQMQTRETLGVK